MTPDPAARRALFPRGLHQPEGGFRFGADTLLLSAFAHSQLKGGAPLAGLDLGCGCGAAAFGLLLLPGREALALTGVDLDPAMAGAAAHNAQALGLAARFQARAMDVDAFAAPAPAHFALCNPPFRIPRSGRPCPDQRRQAARFEGPGGFAAFARCAARNLRTGGQLFLVHLAERLPELFQILSESGLPPRRLLPVQGRAGRQARLALVQAVAGRGTTLVLEPPLALYDEGQTLTAEAARFCPHLAVNACRAAAHTARADNAPPRPLQS